MSFSPLNSPVVIDGVISDEKLAQLLALQAEYPELDFKRTVDLQDAGSTIELAKDIGAMQVRGGYVIVGADDSGTLTGDLDAADARPFDEASLTQKMLRYLPPPLELRSRVVSVQGHQIVIIFIGPHPDGCVFFSANGIYPRNGRDHVAFREGDVFWRDGTRSTRMTQDGHRAVVASQIDAAKASWFEEQHEIRRRERQDLEAASSARQPLGALSLDMAPRELGVAALELARADDTIAFQHLLVEAGERARKFIDDGEIEVALGSLLDRIVCLAATLLMYEQRAWFDRVIELLRGIYSMPLNEGDAQRFGYNVNISPNEPAPRIWLQLMTRLYALGALAVRRQEWEAVRTLTLQLPDRLMDYETNWLRHSLTMMSRAQRLRGQQGERQVELSLLSLAQAQATRLDCLRQDGLQGDDDELLSSLAQFDVLSNIVAVADHPELHHGHTFYSNFARFRQSRIQPLVERVVSDPEMRERLGVQDESDLAVALARIGHAAESEGFRFDGFAGWAGSPVHDFVDDHFPQDH